LHHNDLFDDKTPNLKHQIIYPVKYFDKWQDRVSYEEYIINLLRKSLLYNLTGRVNLKSKIPMTKTFTTIVSHRFANQGLPTMMLLGTTVDRSLIWNFEFGSLGFV
jgi:hypothetical protein